MQCLRSTAGAWIDLCFGDSASDYEGLIQLNDGESHLLADVIVRSGMGNGEETTESAAELVKLYRNVLRVLASFNEFEGPWESDLGVGAGIATNLFSADPVSSVPDGTIPLSDNHVHGGLVFDPRSLHRMLISRTSPLDMPNRGNLLVNSMKDRIHIPLSLAVLRWSSWLFATVVAQDPSMWTQPKWLDHGSPNLKFWTWIKTKNFWKSVEKACSLNLKGMPDHSSLWNEMAQINMAKPRMLPDLSLSECLMDCIDADPPWLFQPESWERIFLIGLIRFSVLTLGSCVARPGDALEVFLDRVSAATLIKNAILSPPQKQRHRADYRDRVLKNRTQALVSALDHMQQSCRPPYGFAGCEFRQNIHDRMGDPKRSVAAVITEIHDAIMPAWRAAHFYLASPCSPDSILFSTPLALQRLPNLGRGSQHPNTSSNWQPGQEFEEAAITVEAIRQLEQELGPALFRKGIGSVDVSGLETWSANWPYSSVINWLNTLLDSPLSFTLHAGESFAYRMRGLRMIGESFLGETMPSRIGHALALDEHASNHIEAAHSHNAELTPTRELISDLCWLHHHHGQKSDRCIKLLCQLTIPAGRRLRKDPEKWVEGFIFLHSGDLVTRIRKTTGNPIHRVSASQDLWKRDASEWNDKDLFDVCYQFSWDEYPEYRARSCDMNHPPETDLLNTVLDYLDTHTQEAEEYVKDLIRDNQTIIEACPTSNLRLTGISQAFDHPLWSWVDQGMQVSVNSDDPLVFLHYGGDEVSFLESSAKQHKRAQLQKTLTSLVDRGHCQSQMVNLQDVTDMIDALESAFARLL